jgi:hypothetical protein
MEAALRRTRTHATALALIAVLLLSLLAGPHALASGGVTPGGEGNGGGGSGKLEGVPPSYAKFSDLVSDKTRLSLRVLGAWSLAEGGPRDNPLNIGPGEHYGTVGKGAKATAQLLRQPTYRTIKRSAGTSDGEQIKAIANSRWCPGCRGYGKLLRSAYNQVKVKGN